MDIAHHKKSSFVEGKSRSFALTKGRQVKSITLRNRDVSIPKTNRIQKFFESTEAKENGYHKINEQKDAYHEQGTSNNSNPQNNDKWISPDGKKEVVFNENGEKVTDSVNMGTYNYANPETNPIGHFFMDMLPYYILGNTPDDPSTFDERILGTYTGDVNTTSSERNANRDLYHEHH